MFGLETNAEKHQVTLEPHVPADWTSFAIRNVHAGTVNVDFEYHKNADSMVLETKRTGSGDCWVEFSPALSLRTQIVSVEMNGRPLSFKLQVNSNDQHLHVRFPVYGGPNSVIVRVKNDFGLTLSNVLPPLGSASRELRILSDSWNASRNQLSLEVSGLAGRSYEIAVWNPGQVASVDGAVLSKAGKLEIQIPGAESDSYVTQKIIIYFAR
jgi:hypothetical protein